MVWSDYWADESEICVGLNTADPARVQRLPSASSVRTSVHVASSPALCEAFLPILIDTSTTVFLDLWTCVTYIMGINNRSKKHKKVDQAGFCVIKRDQYMI